MRGHTFPMAAWAILGALGMGALSASARDLGVRGPTWPVAEPDLLAAIEIQLIEMERSGDMARREAEARERARRLIEEPEPVPGIVPATERRTRRFDPAIVVAEDILGPGGETIAAAGTRIDPFDHVTLTGEVLFVDGRREAEVDWALAHPRPAKIVLLAGRPLDLMRRHGRPFYFDVGGRLTGRFAVRATPTVLAHGGLPAQGGLLAHPAGGEYPRKGPYLLLTEIPVEDPSKTGRAAPRSIPETTN